MKISVIIPTYNAQRTIKKLLDSLASQDCPQKDFEVIVVDDGSTDDTVSIVSNFQFPCLAGRRAISNFQLVRQKHGGAGRTRNAGAKEARGETFLFTDSDCVVPVDWVKKHLQAHQDSKDVGIIGGGVRKPKEGSYLAWADFLSSWFNAHQDLGRHWVKEYLPTLNLSVKKEAFEKIGGFWEKKLTGEDVDFCFRARKKGIKILFDSSLAVWHKSPSFVGFFKHNFNWGYHAPFVRGQEKDLSYHFLFSGGFLKSLFLFLPIVSGYTLFLGLVWWRFQALRFLVCLPLLFLGRLAYGFGSLAGSWQKTLKRNNDY